MSGPATMHESGWTAPEHGAFRLGLSPVGVTLVIILLASIAPFSSSIYLPSIPKMVVDLNTSFSAVQLTLSVYVIGFGTAQLVHGPLSDRYGRRPVLLGAYGLYFLASLGCMLSPNIELLSVFRFVQAVGACAGIAVGRAVFRDSFDGMLGIKALSYLSAAMALGPIMGPMVGGLFEATYGWRLSFVFLAAVGGLGFLLTWGFLGESNRRKNPEATRPARLARNYTTLLVDRRYLGYVMTIAFAYGGVFSFISGASVVFIDLLQVTPAAFGLWFAVPMAGYGVGATISSQISPRMGPARALRIGLWFSVFSGLSMPLIALAGYFSELSIIIPATLFMFGTGFIFPNVMVISIEPYPHMAGTASALMGALQMGTGASFGLVLGQIHDGTQMPLCWLMALAAAGCLAIYYIVIPRTARP